MEKKINVQLDDEGSTDILVGIHAIGKYLKRSHPTVRRMIEEDGLPAVCLRNRWIASKSVLDRYIQQMAQNGK